MIQDPFTINDKIGSTEVDPFFTTTGQIHPSRELFKMYGQTI